VANHKSAKKRARQSEKRRVRNRQYMSAVRTAVKKFNTALENSEAKSVLDGLFTTAQSILAKAGQKGLLHENNSSRRVGRLASALGKSGTEAAKKASTKKKATKKKATKKKATAKKKAASKKKVTKKKK